MDVLIVCPASCATGGPEALHEFTSELNKNSGINARLWYWNITSSPPMPEEYKVYGCEYVTDLPAGYDGVIVYPEIWANHALDYPQCINVVYWLGVDAYASWNPHDCGAFLKDDNIIHIAQSEYAYDFLRKLKVSHLHKCVDVVNADFYEPYEDLPRDDVVLYNPAKATPFTRRLMDACGGIEFKAIKGMTRAEVIDAMHHAKLYLDFGEFPDCQRNRLANSSPKVADNIGDLVSRSSLLAKYDKEHEGPPGRARKLIEDEPPAQSEIVYCKDCVKHNKDLGNYEVHPDGSSTWIWKDSACPLVSWRGKAQGHEFDYQFCAYAERREVTG